MTLFNYIAVDVENQSVSGTVEAADWDAVLAMLAARGLNQCRPAPLVDAPRHLTTLSKANAVELASYLSELAKAGLPLSPGLRALARDSRQGPLPAAMQALAARLESGQGLESALEALGSRLPAHVREMIVAGARTGRLAQALEPVLAHERSIDDLSSRLWQAMAYPVMLFGFLIAWLLFATLWLIPEMRFESLMQDFGRVSSTAGVWNLVEFSRVIPRLLLATACAVLVVVAGARWFGGPAMVSRLFGLVPLVGPAWRSRGLVEFSGLMNVFLDQQLPLADCLRLTAIAVRDPSVAAACRTSAADISAGGPLSESLRRQGTFPPTLVQFVEWGQRHAALAEALESARRMFYERFELQTQWVRLVLPPAVFLFVGISALFMATRFLGGLLSLLWDLS